MSSETVEEEEQLSSLHVVTASEELVGLRPGEAEGSGRHSADGPAAVDVGELVAVGVVVPVVVFDLAVGDVPG